MDLIWLEDLLSVAEKGHFARAAEARNVSQSALTRRIQSLERWAGEALLDRSTHPIALTPAGKMFSARARDIVGRAALARAEIREQAKTHQDSVNIACLHTLALQYVPELVARIQSQTGSFQATIVAETRTINQYLDDLTNHQTDLFICFSYPQVPLGITLEGVPQLNLGQESFAPYQAVDAAPVDLGDPEGPPIAYLEYGATAFLSRIAERMTSGAPFENRLQPVYRATLAESLASAACQNMGVAWLPGSIAAPLVDAGRLAAVPGPWRAQMSIMAIRSAASRSSLFEEIWRRLREISEARD
ncbi:LysR family transcriptional regulator [Oceanicaulis sp.]|jgi:DNA-binding transcriptional LysR family regulator|uniref:LysR family transcriptional regulator n=1 Tax=Oceanicaulis sp. TaxID=1924941 RepID=UPI003F6FE618